MSFFFVSLSPFLSSCSNFVVAELVNQLVTKPSVTHQPTQPSNVLRTRSNLLPPELDTRLTPTRLRHKTGTDRKKKREYFQDRINHSVPVDRESL